MSKPTAEEAQELAKVRRYLASIPASSDSTATNVTFESKREGKESDLCRRMPGGGQNCTKIFLSSVQLFSAIQKLGYFCQAPLEPNSTEIQCTRIVEGPLAPELDVGRSANPTTSISP